MPTKDDLFKNIEKDVLSFPANKKIITYFLDKTIIKSWLRDDGTNTSYARIYMDLLFYIKAKYYGDVNIIIPVDVLIELKNEGVTEVTKPQFKKWISFLAKIMTVDPDSILTHSDSVKKIANVYQKIGYTSCIITLEKSAYQEQIARGMLVVSPTDVIITTLIYYGIGTEQFRSIIDEWLDESNEKPKDDEAKKQPKKESKSPVS